MKTTTSPEPETQNPKPETRSDAFTTHSPEETFALAKSIGEQLKGGEIFLLSGDLGAGKTVFAKGIGAGLGIDPADVTSPSFTLVNIHEGRLKFYHVDLYRLESDSRLDLGLEEIFEDADAVTAIEWAERLQYQPLNSTHVSIEYLSDSERKIEIWQLV
jgi:tRNA threonylcarbamoyladenosine biosynthesis protein TsaE